MVFLLNSTRFRDYIIVILTPGLVSIVIHVSFLIHASSNHFAIEIGETSLLEIADSLLRCTNLELLRNEIIPPNELQNKVLDTSHTFNILCSELITRASHRGWYFHHWFSFLEILQYNTFARVAAAFANQYGINTLLPIFVSSIS